MSVFMDNKYSRWYINLCIYRCDNIAIGYTEVHHIIPRCIGGTNDADNLVRLTAREHVLAHWLLTKMVIGRYRYKMEAAFGGMVNSKNRRRLTPLEYSRARAALAFANMHRMTITNGHETRVININDDIPKGWGVGTSSRSQSATSYSTRKSPQDRRNAIERLIKDTERQQLIDKQQSLMNELLKEQPFRQYALLVGLFGDDAKYVASFATNTKKFSTESRLEDVSHRNVNSPTILSYEDKILESRKKARIQQKALKRHNDIKRRWNSATI